MPARWTFKVLARQKQTLKGNKLWFANPSFYKIVFYADAELFSCPFLHSQTDLEAFLVFK